MDGKVEPSRPMVLIPPVGARPSPRERREQRTTEEEAKSDKSADEAPEEQGAAESVVSDSNLGTRLDIQI